MNNGKTTFAQAIKQALEEELALDPNLIIVGEDILDSETKISVVGDLNSKFPGRIINHLPLVEDMLGGLALGMSMKGIKPIIQMDYGTFLTLALSDIHRLGIWRYRMSEKEGPGIVLRIGHDGYSRKGAEITTSFLATIYHIPNIRIVVPSLPYYAKGLMKAAIRSNQPVLFFEHKKLYSKTEGPEVLQEDYILPFGSSPVFRYGRDITFVSWAYTSFLAMEAAEILSKHGIEAEVISPQTLHPLDMQVIFTSAKKTRCVVVIEEDMLRGGIGAELCARIAENYAGCQVRRVAAKNVPLPSQRFFENLLLPNINDIVATAKDALRNKSKRRWFSLFSQDSFYL